MATLACAGQRRGKALVLDLVGAKAAHALHAGRRRNTISHLRRNGGMQVATHRSGGSQVQVRGQLTIQPGQHRLPEAAHHDAHGRHHGDGRGQRRHQHRSSAQRSAQAARREQCFDSEQSAERARSRRGGAVHHQRSETSPRQRQRAGPTGTPAKAFPRWAGPARRGCPIPPAPAQSTASRLRSTRTSYSRRPRAIASVGGTMPASRAGANAEASATPMPATKASDHGARGKGHGAWAAGDIERIDGGRKHAHGAGGEHAAQGQRSQRTCCADAAQPQTEMQP